MSKREIIAKRKLNAAILLALGTVSSPLYAAVTASNSNFTMLSPAGSLVGGANDVAFTWDGTLNTSTATAVSNATLASNTPFFGLPWTAYNVKVYGPGTYTISTADSTGQSGCPTGLTTCASGGNYNVTVNPGQIMAHMKFAYGSTEGIDVINVWAPGNWTTLNAGDPIYTQTPQGRGVYTGPIYSLISIDWDNDGNAGAGMLDGPFPAHNANFSITANTSTTNNNFTMLSPAGSLVGGANDVAFTWDGTLNTSTATAVSNATLASNTPFFGLPWTAYNVKVYGPGTYTISTADSTGQSGCPTGLTTCASGGNYNVTVNPGQIMAHMKFAYGSTEGIDVINVWAPGNWTTLNAGDPIYTQTPQGRGVYTGPIYSLISIDWDNDGNAGAGMLDGPFPAHNANFNVNAGGNVISPPPCVDFAICPPDIVVAPAPNTSGCTISSSPVNALERTDWGLVAGFLAWLGALRMRFKRRDQS